jgi:hypothetical protein
MPQNCPAPVPAVLAPGDPLEITDSTRRVRVRATVIEDAGERLALRLDDRLLHAASTKLQLRRMDGDGAWRANGVGQVGADPMKLDVELESEWVEAAGRAAARFPADRRLVRVRVVGTPPEAHDLVAIDVSATGCALSGSGTPPAVGTPVVVDITASSYGPPTHLRAVVVRSHVSAFRRFVLGLHFDPRTPSERMLVLRWRDECAVAANNLPLELVAE